MYDFSFYQACMGQTQPVLMSVLVGKFQGFKKAYVIFVDFFSSFTL
jgi:hypothetical protein